MELFRSQSILQIPANNHREADMVNKQEKGIHRVHWVHKNCMNMKKKKRKEKYVPPIGELQKPPQILHNKSLSRASSYNTYADAPILHSMDETE